MFRWHLLIAAFVCAFVFTTDASPAAAQEWEDLGDRDGVRVARMEIEGTSVLAFRGEVVADVHIGKIASVFLNPRERQYWVDRYHSHGTIERGAMSELYWIRFALPIGISDRDYLLQANLEVDEEERVMITRIRSVVDSRREENSCCVRATTQTFYDFRPIPGENRTRLIVEVHTDPRGLIPTFLVNRIQRDWPSKTLGGLIERASQPGIEIHENFRDWHDR